MPRTYRCSIWFRRVRFPDFAIIPDYEPAAIVRQPGKGDSPSEVPGSRPVDLAPVFPVLTEPLGMERELAHSDIPEPPASGTVASCKYDRIAVECPPSVVVAPDVARGTVAEQVGFEFGHLAFVFRWGFTCDQAIRR